MSDNRWLSLQSYTIIPKLQNNFFQLSTKKRRRREGHRRCISNESNFLLEHFIGVFAGGVEGGEFFYDSGAVSSVGYAEPF